MLDVNSNEFSLDTVMSYNGRTVFGVSMSNRTDRGMLYIDTDTYGILKINMERKSQDMDTNYYQVDNVNDSLKRGRVWFRFSVEFEEYENKLYLRRTHESEYNEIIYSTTGKVKIASQETLEFIVTNILPRKENKDATRIRYGQTLKIGAYHPEFWKEYNTLKLTPLNKKLIRDLEQEISLEQQFEKQK
jgi:hypothetical protein